MYNIQAPNYYRAGIYIRLSEADERKKYESESESITNQRSLLLNYIKEQGFIYIDEYIDDGFSGTNFERPGFTRLINDVKKGRINLIIVKDLSRFGRDHVMSGYYIETYFPENNIRFISIQEGIDNAINQASNDSATFLFAVNDYYSKQNSIKIKNVLNDKRDKGKFIGSAPSYGYIRDPNDKGHLLPDPEYAPVVKKIFELASVGIGVSEIATYLNDNKIKTPSSLKRKNPNSKMKYNETWTISSVKKILKNRIYTGDMVQGIQAKVSYKSKKKKRLPECDWKIKENTHEALIDKLTFERMQKTSKIKNINSFNRKKRLFENILYCKECGNTLTVSYRKEKNYWVINCNKYSRDPKRRLCEPHFIPYDKLEKILLTKIVNTYKKNMKKIDLYKLTEIVNEQKQKRDLEIIDLLNKKIKECTKKIDMLYEDRFKGNVSEITYKRLSREVEIQLKKYQDKINDLQEKRIKPSLGNDISNIEKLINIENPSREFIQILIEKILIDKNRNIEIIYRFNNYNF